MFSDLFLYSLKSSVVLAVLYLFYHLLFRKNTHFQLKRGVLLFIILAALVLPLIEFNTQAEFVPEYPAVQYINEERMLDKPYPYYKSIGWGPAENHDTKKTARFHSALTIASGIYLTGAAAMMLVLLLEFIKIGRMLTFGKPRHDLNRRVITHRLIRFPFSFWKWVFIPARISYDQDTWRLIQEHEYVHLRQRHSLDLLLSSLIKCLFWFNPTVYLLQSNIKENHEALADHEVLKSNGLSHYSEALLKVCLETGSLSLGHSFALRSNLSKRIRTMRLEKTSLSKSVVALSLMLLVGFGMFTQTSLYGQDLTERNQLLKLLKERRHTVGHLANRKLSARHNKVFDKIRKQHPNDSLNWTYLPENTLAEYTAEYQPYQYPLYFDQLMRTDKDDLIDQIEKDTSSLMINGFEFYSYEFRDEIREQVKAEKNYLLFYKSLDDPFKPENQVVYEMDEVDVLPEPLGGLDNFTKVIAMDCNVPEGIDRDRLPEFIEFEFVIHGSRHYSATNLVTELKGGDKKNEDIYKFFGEVHSMIRRKIGTVYAWKRGMKDGKPVNVRMILSIPTKYM